MYGNAKKNLDNNISIQTVVTLTFFQKNIPRGISMTNLHLLILDGHGNHVELEAMEQSSNDINGLGYYYTAFTYQPLKLATVT